MNFDPEIYIKLWIDNTDKYGLVYVLITGIIGINFIDGVKILCNLESQSTLCIQPTSNTDTFKGTLYDLALYKDDTKKAPSNLDGKLTIIKEVKDALRKNWYKLGLVS